MIPEQPGQIVWNDGDLPDVHTVPKDCCILAWFVNDFPGGPDSQEWKDLKRHWPEAPPWEEVHGKLRRIECVHPWENDLNPLRWCDSSCHPIGYQEKVKYWAWIQHPFFVGRLLSEFDP